MRTRMPCIFSILAQRAIHALANGLQEVVEGRAVSYLDHHLGLHARVQLIARVVGAVEFRQGYPREVVGDSRCLVNQAVSGN